MTYIYIKNNEILSFDFELDSRYNIGTTYEDYADGLYVRLSNDQVAFMNANQNASVSEIWDMKLNPPYVPTVESVREGKIIEINRYDASEAVNSFSIGGAPMWLDKNMRVGLMNSISIEKASGRTETNLWFGGVNFTFTIEQALGMLNALELYALDCYNTTQRHIAAINTLTTKEEVEAYDFKTGYPDKLNF